MRKLIMMNYDEALENVFALSLVKKPAFRSDFIYLSTEEVQLSTDKEKRLVTGVALIPNTKIGRKGKDGAADYDIMFTQETVELASQQFLKSFNQKEVTKDHTSDVEGATLVESWIKTSEEHDKSVALGIDAPIGSWLVSMKIDNDELWDDILDESVKGFSIEGKFNAKEEVNSINFKEEIMSDKGEKKSLLSKFKSLISSETVTEEVEASSHISEISKWQQEVINDTFAIGDKVERKGYMEGDDNEKVASGEYELEDGRKILIDGDGVIQFIKAAPVQEDAPVEEAPVETEEVEAAEEVPAEEVKEEKTYVDVEDYNSQVERINELEESLAIVLELLQPKEEAEPAKELEVAASEQVTEVEVEVIEEVVEELSEEVEETPEMISLTEEAPAKVATLKFDSKMTTQERIKASLARN